MSEVAKTQPITQEVLLKVQEYHNLGQLTLPADYHAENALKSAQIMLNDMVTSDNKPVLQVCTKASIGNALFEMVTQGLSPMKKQCAFIVRGNKLCMQREYPGTIALAKRYAGLTHISSKAIFKNDPFKYGTDLLTGRTTIFEHQENLENRIKENLVGAFAVAKFEDGTTDVCVMSISEIRQSWLQGAAKGNSPAHRNFPDQMAEKTVINRLLKRYVDGSVDDFEIQERGETAQQEETKQEQEVETIDVVAEVQEVEVVEEPTIVLDSEQTIEPGF